MQPIFSRNIEIDKIAFLNWRIEGSDILNFQNVGDGFLLSAIELAKLCLKDNKRKQADIIIFPIFNNANHGIEMYLKALNLILSKLLHLETKVEKTHNIQNLFATLKSKVERYKGNLTLKDFNEATKGLENYINELFKKIEANPKNDKMDFSRYPFSSNYDYHFYVTTSGNVEIDLENFVDRFQEIKQNLDNLTSFLYFQELNQEW